MVSNFYILWWVQFSLQDNQLEFASIFTHAMHFKCRQNTLPGEGRVRSTAGPIFYSFHQCLIDIMRVVDLCCLKMLLAHSKVATEGLPLRTTDSVHNVKLKVHWGGFVCNDIVNSIKWGKCICIHACKQNALELQQAGYGEHSQQIRKHLGWRNTVFISIVRKSCEVNFHNYWMRMQNYRFYEGCGLHGTMMFLVLMYGAKFIMCRIGT